MERKQKRENEARTQNKKKNAEANKREQAKTPTKITGSTSA